jgi:hypothetical protein
MERIRKQGGVSIDRIRSSQGGISIEIFRNRQGGVYTVLGAITEAPV